MLQHLRSVSDLSADTLEEILDRSFKYKNGEKVDAPATAGKVVAMVFEKPSLRTKTAFEVAAASLSATPVYLTSSQIMASGNHERGRESVPDIARNLERFCDLILARVYYHSTIQEICKYVDKPVINALCDQHHPTQALADLMAFKWHKGDIKGRKIAYVGDGNNVATSLAQICALYGVHCTVASPEDYSIPESEKKIAQEYGSASGAEVNFIQSPEEALSGADGVYTDTFVSMGQESEKVKRVSDFKGYQVNMELLKHANEGAVFMHCMPAHRGEEVTDEVMDSEQSIVFDQAECRLHVAKALYSLMLG